MTAFIAPIVEGHTEVRCVERLLGRIWRELLGRAEIRLQVLPAVRGQRSSIVHPTASTLPGLAEEAGRELAAKGRRNSGAALLLLVILDAENDEPVALQARLAGSVHTARSDIPGACVVAVKSLENWFIAAAESLAAAGLLPAGTVAPEHPDDIPGTAAYWLTQRMRQVAPPRKYTKPDDGVEFARVMDLAAARDRSPSFARLCQALEACVPPAAPDPDPPPA